MQVFVLAEVEITNGSSRIALIRLQGKARNERMLKKIVSLGVGYFVYLCSLK